MSRSKGRNTPRPRPGYKEIPYWQSAAYNEWLYETMLDECMTLALNRFRWEGLPRTCDQRYLETALLTEGRATFARSPTKTNLRSKGAIYSLKYGGGHALTMYGIPSRWRAIGSNGTNFPVSYKTGVIVYDNLLHIAPMSKLVIYARELADIYRTRQINRLHQKVPWLLKTDQDHQLDAVNLFANVAGNEPVTIVDKNFSQFTTIEKIDLQSPYIGEQLDSAERTAWNRIYTALGIKNVSPKAERMIEDEVIAQDEPASLLAQDPIRARRFAIEEGSRVFGSEFDSVAVYWSEDYESSNFNVEHDTEKRMEALKNV